MCCSYKHVGPKADVAAREALDRTAEQIAKKYRLEFLNSGLGSGLVGYTPCLWALSLVSHDNMTIDQARPIAKDIAQTLLNKIYTDPLFAAYCKTAQPRPTACTLTDDKVGFRLAFWDADVNRPLKPYLAQIRFADGKLYYHYANPQTQALEEPIVEPLIAK